MQSAKIKRDNNFRPAKEEIYMVIDSRVSHCLLGEEHRPFDEETTYYLKHGYTMELHYKNTLSAMISNNAWLFATKEDAEFAKESYMHLASKAMAAAKRWQVRHQKIKQIFPKHNPICFDYDEYLSLVTVDEEIRYRHENIRVIKVTLSEEEMDKGENTKHDDLR